MSQQRQPQKIAQAVEGFSQMDVTQTAFNTYTVTSWRNGTTTAHTVDLAERTCSCEDDQFNREGSEACAHILKAGHVAEANPGTEEHVLRFLSNEARAVRQAAEDIRQTATSMESHQQAAPTATGSAPTDEDTEDTVEDPVARFEALLRDAGLPVDAFEIYVHDQYGSLQINQDGYLESEDFETWTEISDDMDLGYAPDDDVNTLAADRFPEVLG